MLMGTVYLAYSAYYVSMNMDGIKFVINVIINVIYLFLFIVVFRNSLVIMNMLKMHQLIINNNDVF